MGQSYSEDYGKTWSPVRSLNKPCVMAFSSIIQLKNGDYMGLYQPRKQRSGPSAAYAVEVCVARWRTDLERIGQSRRDGGSFTLRTVSVPYPRRQTPRMRSPAKTTE